MGDCRPYPQIPAPVFPAVFFAMFSCRIGSFNDLKNYSDRSSWRNWLDGHALPCPDELAYVSERLDVEGLRRCLCHLYHRLKRNKVLETRNGWALAAIDGHEIGSSYKRCCENCLQREVEVGGERKIQYYHRLVAFQLIGASNFCFLLDLELVRPEEDEVAAALRLIERVLKNCPRCFDLLSADALYLRPSVLDCLRAHGKHLLAVVRDNQPGLLQEVRTLMTPEPPRLLSGSKSNQRIELRDMEGFTTDSIEHPLRVVWSHEETLRRERIAGRWHSRQVVSDWIWATTLTSDLASAERISAAGHDRWKIENEGFNELVTHWHANHYYHHHPNSILVLWLMLFMAHAVFHCFYRRNLKPQRRAGHSVIYFADSMAASMSNETWWPPPT